MAENGLGQHELEQLTAWMDGELGERQAREVAERVASDPRWRRVYEDFTAVDRALEMATPPAPPADLTERILRGVRRRRLWGRVIRVAGAAAVAAGIVIAVAIGLTYRGRRTDGPGPSGPGAKLVAQTLRDVPASDRFMVENLQLFQNYDRAVAYEEVRSIADDETLAVLAALEHEGRS